VQHRVFGIGPKDVKLSQDALEVLSLIAYKQPVGKEAVDAHVKENAGNILRQLLQRQLVSLHRDGDDAQDITYRTTPRFLQVFGLTDLSELPQSEELSFK
jgi:segregation and condensation protein B